MRHSIHLNKIIKRPLLFAIVAVFAAGCSDSEAEYITQKAKSENMQNPTSAKDDQFQSRVVEIQIADGSSYSSSNEPHSDSNMAAENWGNIDGPDTHAVVPSGNDGMAAETWRTLEQSVSHSNLAGENWNNPDGPDTHAIAPSNNEGMAAETWRTLVQTVSHSNLAAENWGNPDGPDTHIVEPSSDGDMAAENWRETR